MNFSKNVNPCYGCNERHEMCHALCDRYATWAREYAEMKEKYRRDRLGSREAFERFMDVNTRLLRRRHQTGKKGG